MATTQQMTSHTQTMTRARSRADVERAVRALRRDADAFRRQEADRAIA